ncbi:MAG: 4-hydroxy-3-methylbut-2-enyl diphosphate reductase, partial [Cyanobacteria bacterium]|nr:4-hydroxy-3-methylbut-2-enyl diphosphate reductase [Cyanobacteriota bacterium]
MNPINASTIKKPKKILIAEHSGFCHGVKRAVDKTVETGANTDKPVYVLGQLIHNQQVIDQLAEQGIITVKSLDEVPSGSVCVIRTHGAPPQTVEAAEAKGIEVSDATCPDVRLVQNKAIQLAEEGYTVVVVGKNDHPEVIGITAYAERIPGAHIISINHPSEIEAKLKDQPKRRIGVVSQTTQMEDTFFQMVKELSKVAKELKVFNTICPATYFRQNAALDLAGKVDFMVV